MGLTLPTACWHEPNRLLEARDGRHSMSPPALNGPQSASWESGKGSVWSSAKLRAMDHTHGSHMLGRKWKAVQLVSSLELI